MWDLVLWGHVLCGCCVVHVLRLRDEESVVWESLGVSTGSLQLMDGCEYSLCYGGGFNNTLNTYVVMLALVV